MLWISCNTEVVIAPEFGDVGKGNSQCAIVDLYEPGIEEGEPGNPVVIKNSVEHFIPVRLDLLKGDIACAHRPRIRQSFIETSPNRGWGDPAQDDRSRGSR